MGSWDELSLDLRWTNLSPDGTKQHPRSAPGSGDRPSLTACAPQMSIRHYTTVLKSPPRMSRVLVRAVDLELAYLLLFFVSDNFFALFLTLAKLLWDVPALLCCAKC